MNAKELHELYMINMLHSRPFMEATTEAMPEHSDLSPSS